MLFSFLILWTLLNNLDALPSISDCGVNYACYRQPANCTGNDCLFLYKWVDDGTVTHFEMNGAFVDVPLTKIWMGLCLSNDQSMGNDDAHICRFNDGSLNPADALQTVQHYYNVQRGVRPNYLLASDPQIGISDVSVKLENNILTCKFTRIKQMNVTNYFDIAAKKYFVLSAHGILNVVNNVTNTLIRHTIRIASSEAYNFTEIRKRHVCTV